MVRAANWRIKKYEQKFDPTVVSARFTALKDMAVDQVEVRFSDLASLEETVKTTISDKITNPMDVPQYLNVAREIWKKAQTHTGKVLVSEANIIKAKWVARGLDASIIDLILDLFGLRGVAYYT